MRRGMCTVFLLALLTSVRSVSANPPDDVVQHLIDQATRSYDKGRFEDALKDYLDAYHRSNEKGLLYVIGLSYQQLGRLPEALAALEQFVASDAPPEPKARAMAAIRDIYEQLGTKVPQPAPTSAASHPSYAPWTWVTLGTGMALAAAGTVVFVLGYQDHRKVIETEGYDTGGVVHMTQARALALKASGDRKMTAGYALWGVGGGALIGSAVLFVLQATARHPQEKPIAVAPFVGTAGLLLQGRF